MQKSGHRVVKSEPKQVFGRRLASLPKNHISTHEMINLGRYHAGSVVAQFKKDRVRTAQKDPVGSKSKQGLDNNEIIIGPEITILSINVEGLSMAKCEYISKLSETHKVDVILLQETHVGPNTATSKYTIPNFTLVNKLCHDKYGTMIFAKYPQLISPLQSNITEGDIHTSSIKIKDTTIVNVYKPPPSKWLDPPLPRYEHPAVIIGDFNSQHTDWGYRTNNKNGEIISNWANHNNYHLEYSPLEKGTFSSGRWQKDYTPDLVFTSNDQQQQPLKLKRQVLDNFPRSQHRPVLVKLGTSIPMIASLPKPRWNFQKANWNEFIKEIENTCIRIPARQDCINRFTKLILKSAKNHIPRGHRKRYIPCWSKRSQELLNEYERTQDPNTADELLNSLQEGRKERWIEMTENIDFGRSSRHAWNLLKKLNPEENKQTSSAPAIEVEAIAKQIKQRSLHTPNHKFEKEIRKTYQQIYNSLPEHSFSSIPVSLQEITTAIKQMKAGKSAGIDGVYPDMIKNLGPNAIKWLASAFSDVIETTNYPITWKHSKILAILKPGKDAKDPASYRPISLLCCLYKLLERIILERLSPQLDNYIPVEQAGFRPKRDTTEQVLALTSNIEAGYEKREKTGVVFIDLSAAYDTVWHEGLMYKLAKVIHCKKTLKLIDKLTGRRIYHVCLGKDTSPNKTIKNGVPQGSVLAPTLFNIYISDLPTTTSQKFGYADDLAMSCTSKDIKTIQNTLSKDTQLMQAYFDKWYLKMNTTKTVSTLFHLNNSMANLQLDVKVGNTILPNDPNPKYLGVTLDRTLTYRKHIENTANKLKKRNSLIRKLSGTSWGATPKVLRTSALALNYSVAEYCAPVWSRCAHTKNIDTLLNDTMRTISGALKSTPTPWLPTLCGIAPPHLRRELATQKQHARMETVTYQTPLKDIIEKAPVTTRLKSRKPFYRTKIEEFDISRAWQIEWSGKLPKGAEIINNPTEQPLPGFNTLHRKEWVQANRIRSRHGRTCKNLQRWGYRDSSLCPHCEQAPQDIDHLVLHCPITALPGGYNTVHQAKKDFTDWIKQHKIEM